MDHYSDLSTTQHNELKNVVMNIKMATQNNKWKIITLGGLMTGSATVGGLVSKLLPFMKG